MIFGIKFLLAFCSITYELILAQCLAAFLENTVLRYSVTVGLYLFSMGVGSFLAEKKTKHAAKTLLRAEALLVLCGGLSVVFLFAVDYLSGSRIVFSAIAHGLIVLIGILTGLELPLLIHLQEKRSQDLEHQMIGFDYAGAFAGTLFFVFVIFPRFGLVAGSFFVGLINALTAATLFWALLPQKGRDRPMALRVIVLYLIISVAFCVFLWNSGQISRILIEGYLH